MLLYANILLTRGIREDSYKQFKIYVENELITIFVHQLVIEEVKRNIYRNIQKVIDKYKSDINTIERKSQLFFNHSLPERKIIYNKIDETITNIKEYLKINIIEYDPINSIKTIKDYFDEENAFITGQETKWEVVKKNFIDSIIAHDYLKHSNENIAYLITNNVKDFEWMKNKGVHIYDSYENFITSTQAFINTQLNYPVHVEPTNIFSILNKNKDNLLKLIAPEVKKWSDYEIKSEKFCLARQHDVRLHFDLEDILNRSDVEFDNPVIFTAKESTYELSVPFRQTIDAHASYTSFYQDLNAEGLYTYNDKEVIVNQYVLEVTDDSGEGILEVSHSCKVYLKGILVFKVKDKSIKTFKDFHPDKLKLFISENDIYLDPTIF